MHKPGGRDRYRDRLIATLLELHTYCRPMGSTTEDEFIAKYIATLPNAERDPLGNWHVTIGDSRVLWSCHTDTVHADPGRQTVAYSPKDGIVCLSRRSARTSSCLGADDTAGVFICREMIARKVPGHYIFHYGEERGGIGSRGLAEDYGDWLKSSFDCAIALDRKGTQDVITWQGAGRTASDTFAKSLAAGLGLNYAPCDTGIYTDTAEYAELIPECTNLSIGYESAHSRRECLDVNHVLSLLDALTVLDTSALVIERDPAEMWIWGDEDEDEDEDETGRLLDWYARDRRDDRRDLPQYLDPVFERVQRELQAQIKRGKG
jgi:acetylornithine deacetylase/succinyl-diaminopimelate desuccinylase-like protein